MQFKAKSNSCTDKFVNLLNLKQFKRKYFKSIKTFVILYNFNKIKMKNVILIIWSSRVRL